MLRLTLYGRAYCHLCDEMREALRAFESPGLVQVEYVDVDSRPELDEQFGELVPVLFAEGDEICHYRLDESALRMRLKGSAEQVLPVAATAGGRNGGT